MRQLLLFVLLVFAAPAFAFEAQAPLYLNPELIVPQLLPPPAGEHSPAWDKQLAMVAKAQTHVSKADQSAMEFEQKVSVAMVSNALGKHFDVQHYPKTFMLLGHVLNDTALVTEAAKTFWGTRRPYVAAPQRITLLIDPVNNNAYPSGHTSISYTLAETLGMLLPEKRAVLRARADSIAHHRIEAGVHYPQDIEGGKRLGGIILGAMLQSDEFQEDLKQAKDEISTHEK